MTALLLTAVGCTWVKASVALATDHLIAVVLLGQHTERGLDDTTTKTENQMESGLLLDIVVGQGASILQLLTSEDQSRQNIINIVLKYCVILDCTFADLGEFLPYPES